MVMEGDPAVADLLAAGGTQPAATHNIRLPNGSRTRTHLDPVGIVVG